jgi:hypothetical protein
MHYFIPCRFEVSLIVGTPSSFQRAGAGMVLASENTLDSSGIIGP